MRILVIKPSSLGDIVHGMVVVSELKMQRPDCVIDWVVGDRFFDIVSESKIASRVIVYERHGGMASVFPLIREIRREVYDYVFDMQGLARSGLMTFFSKSLRKIGRKDARELAFLAYSETIAYPGPVHAIDILKEFLSVADCKSEVSGLVKELKNIQSPLFKLFLEKKTFPSKIVCIFPESRRKEKKWSFFIPLIQNLLEQTKDIAIFVLGNECFTRESLVSPFLFDLCGQTSLRDIVVFIQNAQLVIANDSGPLHISAALGRPTLGLFTATDPLRFGPYPFHRSTNMALQLKNTPSEVDTILQKTLEILSYDAPR
ncbi:MAG: glycosyltransferase family 9 protein [Puniceicoccales bacterium]|jgi:ADP-heptose:LPS heptosyltransferase|nr:glycosyltransferase family 9 protein [Puniceicoccales bacterium]